MAPKRNPKKLNKLQLKTLALFQGFADSDLAGPGGTRAKSTLAKSRNRTVTISMSAAAW